MKEETGYVNKTSNFRRYCVIVRVSVVLKLRTVLRNLRFDNLSGSHL